MPRRVVFLALSLAATGCLLFTDLGAYDALDPDAVDAAPESTSASDVTTSDVGVADTGVDVTTDAGVDAGNVFGCKASDAAFCADFDDGPLSAQWDFIDPSTGGRTLQISNALARSPSSSLHSALDRAVINPPSGDCTYARVRRDLATLGLRTRVRFDFDLWLGAPSGPPVTEGILVANLHSSKDCNFIISVDDLGCGVVFQFKRNNTSVEDNVNAAFDAPLGKKWAHVGLDVSFDPSAPKWSLSVNGERCGMEKAMPVECQGAQTFSVAPGVYCETPGSGVVEIYLDNIEVR